MLQHNRTPALIVLAVVLGGGAVAFWRSGNANASASDAELAIARLETQIANGHATLDNWVDYGKALQGIGHDAAAAAAYHKVLDLEPSNRAGRIGYALALAHANNAEPLYGFLRELTALDPKLALNLLEDHNCQTTLGPERYAALYREAKAQAAD